MGTRHCVLLKQRNTRLGCSPTRLTDAVTDISVMLVLKAQRSARESMARVAAGQWSQTPWYPPLMIGPDHRGSTVGFLGFGRIAQATLKRLIGFGIKDARYLTSKPGQPVKEDHVGLVREAALRSNLLRTQTSLLVPATSSLSAAPSRHLQKTF